ncbi:hypothetical protein MJO28_009113 [Puccinia striiformis f. sp. tritici]|uniref:Uncharacterized protein n=1 Tax=Puccinia striiformis f. sp. tritici TaxID=168172 RepID=A0ACC0E659_9BASI|nr:hypothetical protein MJO28_009113 [Puccinia striiformis f. sp. tritici]
MINGTAWTLLTFPSWRVIPPTSRSKHAESPIVLLLYQLHNPSLTALQNWAKMIADSVETMAFQLYNPAQTNTHTEDGYFTQAGKLLPN